jgi:hypothetical protein
MRVIPQRRLSRASAFATAMVLVGCDQDTLQPPNETTTAIPDLSGIWARNSLTFEQPASGPGPLIDLSPSSARVGDYNNPILKPAAAEQVKRTGEIELGGRLPPDPENQCLLHPMPYLLRQMKVRIHQQAHQVTIIYRQDQQVRRIRMSDTHPVNVTPSVYGDSIGYYEGDTLVIDTIGIKAGPIPIIDWFGTPYSDALHVVERYSLIDYKAGKEAVESHEAKYGRVPPEGSGIIVDPDYRGKALQIELTVDDPGVFTMPWKARLTFRKAASEWPEYICAENLIESDGKERSVPTAHVPDF